MIVVITLTQQMRCGVICAHVGETANFKWPADGTKNLEKNGSKKNYSSVITVIKDVLRT